MRDATKKMILVAAMLVGACGGSAAQCPDTASGGTSGGDSDLRDPTTAPETITVSIGGLADGGAFPMAQVFSGFGCTGENHSPALTWTPGPEGTQSYAIVMHDPDAPTGVGFFHWVVVDVPASITALPENAAVTEGGMPSSSIQAYTDFGANGYGGPCPPPGAPHRYEISVYALDVPSLGVLAGATGALTRFMLAGHTLALGRAVATYGRSPRGAPAARSTSPSPSPAAAVGDPADTLDIRDCVCDQVGCTHPCFRQSSGELCIYLDEVDVSDMSCGMQQPCCHSASELPGIRARRLARGRAVTPPSDAPIDPLRGCVVAREVPRLAIHEVTVAEYAQCVAAGACSPAAGSLGIHRRDWSREPNTAVTAVTREQAAAYCADVGSRLPTEAEWLAAARADCQRYPWGNDLSFTNSNCASGDRGVHVAPPGSRPLDVVRGVYDLHGNVSEWTSDGPSRGAPYCGAILGEAEEIPSWSFGTGIRCLHSPGI